MSNVRILTTGSDERPPTPRRRRRARQLIGAAAGLLLLAGQASAEVRSGSGADPSTDGGPGPDVVALEASYDTAGSITVVARFRDPVPAVADHAIYNVLGVRQADGSCERVVDISDGVGQDAGNASWAYAGEATPRPSSRSLVDATTIRMSASDPSLADRAVNCAWGFVAAAGPTVTDSVAIFDLTPPPPPPPPAPPAVPSVAVTATGARDIPLARGRTTSVKVILQNTGSAPATGVRVRVTGTGFTARPATSAVPTIAVGGRRVVSVRITRTARRGAPVVRVTASGTGVATTPIVRRLVVPAPRLGLVLSGAATAPLRRGGTAVVRATIRNTGTAAARNVRLRVSGGGISVSPADRRVGTIAAGGRRVVAVRVTRRSPRGTVAARFTVSGTGVRSVSDVRRFTGGAAPTPTPAAKGPDDLTGRMYVHIDHGVMGLIQPEYYGYFFVNSRFVYRGYPEGGVPVCTRRTAPDAKEDGCVPYTYDHRARRLVVDGVTTQMAATRQSFTVDQKGYVLRPTLAAGSRHKVGLKTMRVFGLYPNQTVSTTYFFMYPNGEFAFGSSMMGSTGYGTSAWVQNPDEKGTYRILAGGTIEFTYASGKVTRSTILIDGNGKNGNPPNPQDDGLLLDESMYWSSAD